MKIKISIKNAILALLIVTLFSTIVFAIPNSLTLQGKLTNLAGASQQWILKSGNNALFHLE